MKIIFNELDQSQAHSEYRMAQLPSYCTFD